MAVAPKPTAERRQLTVLFCDIVGSTALSERLDPEDLRDVLERHQQVAVDVVERHRGTVGKYLGDGLLVYFGFPAAGEDDATRAVRAALEMVERVGELAELIREEQGVQLRIRVGVHTGLVVAGEIGAVGQRVVDIVGETPNIAARLQDLAAPDTVVISADTHRLVSRFFRTVSLGDRMLKGLTRTIEAFAVEGESGARNRLEGVRLNPLVGRETEMALLRRLWQRATEGVPHTVLLSGEAGIGKSRLTIGLEDEIGEAAHVIAMSAFAHGANSAFAPVVDMLRARMGIESSDSNGLRIAKIEDYLAGLDYHDEDAVPLLADLLSIVHDRPLSMSPEMKKGHTEELLLDMLAARSATKPVLLTVEDVHWADPSTLRLLTLHIARLKDQRVLSVFTTRPEFVSPWTEGERLVRVSLARLDAYGTGQLVREVTGGVDLPAEIMAQILAKTEGVPLYVEELVAMVVESGALHPSMRGVGEAHAPLSIPATLQDSLMARLDRLNPTKDVVQYASLLGRNFSRRLLALVCGQSEAALSLNLNQVVESDILHPDGEGYRFKHALIQDAAYDSMLRSTRQERHARVAQILRDHFPEIEVQQPEVLARHLTEGGHKDEAVRYWERAGKRALARAANLEAIGHLRHALDALAATPEGVARLERELALQTALGPALMSTRGFAAVEVEHTYDRAREISRALGDPAQMYPVLWGLWAFRFIRGDLDPALELAREVYDMAEATGDPGLMISGIHAVGYTRFYRGDYAGAWAVAERGLALFNPETELAHTLAFQNSLSACIRLFGGASLWMMGDEDEGRRLVASATELAKSLQHPPSIACTLGCVAYFEQIRGDAEAVALASRENIAISEAEGFALWLGAGLFFQGWAKAQVGDASAKDDLDLGYVQFKMTGTALVLPQIHTMLAQEYRRAGKRAEALDVLEEAIDQASRTSERHLEPEAHRLKGEILAEEAGETTGALADALERQAEASFRQAVEIARLQGAVQLERRALASLAGLAKTLA